LALALLIAGITWIGFRSRPFWEVAGAVAVILAILFAITEPPDPNDPPSMF
jgi:hypothetical protein